MDDVGQNLSIEHLFDIVCTWTTTVRINPINLANYADGLSVKACGVANADVATVKQEVINGLT